MKRWNWRGWWARVARNRHERLKDALQGNARTATTAAAAAWSPIVRPVAPLPEQSSSATAPRIRIHCFGGFAVEADGRLLSSRGWAEPWQILAYLAVNPADGVPRTELVRAIWGDNVPAGNSRVNVALGRLRRLLQDQVPGLCSTVVTSQRDGRVSLDTTAIQSDAQETWRTLATATRLPPGERRAVLALVRTLTAVPLLEGCRWPWLQQRDAHGRTLEQRLVMRLDARAQLGDDEAVEQRQPRMAPSRPGRCWPAPPTSAPPYPC